ncbi:MAG: hypothetical protein PHH12_01815 [Candidatus Shapirobacteria bacterium]|nr:hypothetical protein [Candidatus Shapirobacteria bacterium]
MEEKINPYEVLDNLSKSLIKRIDNGNSIQPERLYLLMEVVSKIIEKGETEKLGESFDELRRRLQSYYQYGYIEKMESGRAFDFGAVWSIVKMIEIINDRKQEPILIRHFAEKYFKYYQFFFVLKEFSGIEFFELVKKTKMSISELAGLVARLQWERFFSFSRLGKKAYFYLEERGEELLMVMEEIKK